MAFKELYQPVHTIIGEGCINEIPRHINNIGVNKALIVTDEVRKSKMLCVDSNSLAYLAINDPAMMVNMPPSLTAATGMDALTHSIEAFVANSRCPFTDGIALESIRLIGEYLERAVKDGKTDMEAREKMCWAQYMGGLAFSNAGLGMVHAMAHQLGGFYDTPHGVANAILLPYVMRFNLPKAADRYAEVAKAFGFNTAEMTQEQAAMAAIRFIEELKKTIKIPRLADTAFQPEDAKALALNAMKDTGMPENPRQPSVEEVIGVFYEAYLGE